MNGATVGVHGVAVAAAALDCARLLGAVVTMRTTEADPTPPSVTVDDPDVARGRLARVQYLARAVTARQWPAVAAVVVPRDADPDDPVARAAVAVVGLHRTVDAVAAQLADLGYAPVAAQREARRWVVAAAQLRGAVATPPSAYPGVAVGGPVAVGPWRAVVSR